MINIDDKTRRLSQATIVVGYKQENKAESIEFKIPDYLKEYGKKICFKTKDGKVFSKLFDNTTSNIFTFTRTETQYGELNATIEFFKTENEDMIVYKTSMLHIIFNETINCEDEVQPDEPKIPILESLIEKVTDLNNTITENEETRNNNEDTRISNENERKTNEQERVISEEARVEAETQREEKFVQMEEEQTVQNNRLDSLEKDNSTNKTDISNIKQEQTTQNTNISNLQTDNTSNKAKILDLEAKNTEQDTSIQTNTESIEQIKSKDITQDSLIEQLQAENTKLKKEINSMQIPGEAIGNPIHLTDSSDMECEIAVVGNSEQETREGYNLLKFDNELPISVTKNGVTVSIDKDGIITINGTATATSYFGVITDGSGLNGGAISNSNINLELDNTKKYTFSSKKLSGTISSSWHISARFMVNSQLTWKEPLLDGNVIIENSTGINEIYIAINNGTVFNNFKFTLNLYEGTEEKEYEPYGAMPSPDYPSEVVTVGQNGSVEIEVCNKNYFDNTEINLNIVGIDSHFFKNKIILNGTTTSNSDIHGFGKDIKLKKGTYTFSYKCENKPANNSCQIIFKNKQKKAIATLNGWYDTTKVVKTFEEDVVISKDESFVYTNKNMTYQNTTYIVQIEAGAVATEPVEHESYTKVLPIQKEFVKIGDVEDTFVKVDGKWYEKHNIKKLTLDGTESWNWHSDGFGFTKAAGISIVPNNKVLAISNFLLGIQMGSNGTYYKDKDNVIFSWMSGNLICLKATNKFTDVETLKSWLAEQYANGTPVIVYYVLQEPELIPCTAEQEKILNSFYTYKGVTNVSMIGIGTLKVNYKKDLETMFNNIIKQIPSSTSDTTET